MNRRDQRLHRAFEDLVRRCAGQLFRTAMLLSGNHHQAEDLVQTTFAKMYGRRGWNEVSHPEAYLRQVLTNEFLSARRRRWTGEISVATFPEQALDDRTDSEAAARVDLFRALGSLSVTDRAVVVLRFWEDLSILETAAILGCSSGAVRSRSGRALGQLRSLLADAASTTPALVTRERER